MKLPTYRQAGQWWSQPNPRLAYYCCLRWIYQMTAREALDYLREIDVKHPNFFGDLGTLRREIHHED